MNSILLAAATFVGLGSAACNNYVVPPTSTLYLYPVGTCYETSNYDSSVNLNKIWMCEDDGNNGLKAVEYTVGLNCDTSSKTATSTAEVSCNGPSKNETCSCVIGGDASECSFYERTNYVWNIFGETECDKTRSSVDKYVVDVCIVDYDRTYSSLVAEWYGCGSLGYNYNYGDWRYRRDCTEATGSPSASPTTVVPTRSPTMKPTMAPTNSEITTTIDYINCSEEECDGTQGPRAGAKAYSLLFAVVAVFLNAMH